MIFCDLSTPKSEGVFSVYDDIRSKLLAMGVPENEIAYIHDAKTEAQKKDLFSQGALRSGACAAGQHPAHGRRYQLPAEAGGVAPLGLPCDTFLTEKVRRKAH